MTLTRVNNELDRAPDSLQRLIERLRVIVSAAAVGDAVLLPDNQQQRSRDLVHMVNGRNSTVEVGKILRLPAAQKARNRHISPRLIRPVIAKPIRHASM